MHQLKQLVVNKMKKKISPKKFFMISFILCIELMSLISCGSTSNLNPPITIPNTFSQSGSSSIHQKWWFDLNDKQLNNFIEIALANNLTLQSTWDKLEQARAVAKKSGADIYPSIEGSANVVLNEAYNDKGWTNTNEFSLNIAASYEIDLWRRINSTREAARYDFLASQEDLYAAAISLTGEVANVWYKIIEQQGQIKLLEEQTQFNEQYLDLVMLHFTQGSNDASAIDVLQQSQSLESVRKEKILAEMNEKVLENQLAVLLGKSPGSIEIPIVTEFPELPTMPNAGLPIKLIQKRPDIHSAFLKVKAYDQRVAAAIADQFPVLSFTASIETGGNEINNLFQNWIGTLIGNLLAPIFDGGRKAAEVERTKAVLSEAIHSYGQTVLEAFNEVENSIIREKQQKKLLDNLKIQLDLSKNIVNQTQERYFNGGIDYLRFITALMSHQSLERSYLTAKRDIILYRISLYRALGTNWEMKRTKLKAAANDNRTKER